MWRRQAVALPTFQSARAIPSLLSRTTSLSSSLHPSRLTFNKRNHTDETPRQPIVPLSEQPIQPPPPQVVGEDNSKFQYDVIVIGSGPAGQKASIQAAKLGKRVALVDKSDMLGGICVNTGTIPSKTLREAIIYLSGYHQKLFYGRSYKVKDNWTFEDLTYRVEHVIRREKEVISDHLIRNHVHHFPGAATFADQHTLSVCEADGHKRNLTAKNILVAVGTRPARDPKIPCDGVSIFDSDQILTMRDAPRNLIVVGAGVIGVEYAAMLGSLTNTQVTVIDQRPNLLEFVDREIIDNLTFHMRQGKAKFRLGEKVKEVKVEDASARRVVAQLESGKRVIGDSLLYAVGRQCNTDTLSLENAGLTVDKRGKLEVNANYQTSVPNIYAAGDVIGFPSLASSSMLQGRLAVCHMFGQRVPSISPNLIPFGIYSIPEISLVGKNEQELTQESVPYEYGIARYSDLAKGMMQGDEVGGLLKILFHLETHKILGVHCIGENATELIHVGQAAIAMGATIEYFTDNVFNYPTFSEAYQVAALDGVNKLPTICATARK